MTQGFRIAAMLLSVATVFAQDPGAVWVRGATVFVGADLDPQARDVLLRGGRIAALVEPGGAAPGEGGAREVDARGGFLIPGLFDMHVHAVVSPGFAPLFVAHGVLAVRSMADAMPMVTALRRRIASGAVLGPRIVAAGRILDGPQAIWPGSAEAADADAARAAMEQLVEEGSEFVKVYSKLPRDAYFAAAEAAVARGVPFAGHVPRSVGAAEAAAAGQRSIEHFTGVFEACAAAGTTPPDGASWAQRSAHWVAAHDPERAAALFATLVEHGTYVCPTLAVARAIAHLDDPALREDPRLRYLPAFWLRMWDPHQDRRFAANTADDWRQLKGVFEAQQRLVGEMHRAGVRLLVGTDVANPFVLPGFSLHDELALLVDSGLPPHAVLRAATRDAAEFCGLLDQVGTIEVGKAADLVLLDADPLVDIEHSRRIRGVAQQGRWLDRAALDQVLGGLQRKK